MPADRLRPEDIDAAIAATQIQSRRNRPRLDPADLTPVEASYRARTRQDPEGGGGRIEPEIDDSAIPPYPEKPRPDLVYADPEARLAGSRRRRPWAMLVAGLALGGFAAIVWWAYGAGPSGEAGPAPLIKAEEGPVKIRPEDEGGLQVPFQDKLVYGQIEPDPDRNPVEHLLPPPPTPIEPPAPTAVETQPPVDVTSNASSPGVVPESDGAEDGAPNPPAIPAIPLQTAPLAESAEDAPAEPADVAAAPAEIPEPPADVTSEAAKPEVAEVESEAVEPEPAPAAKPEPVTDEPPQTAKATPGAFRIQLAAFRSHDAAATAWTKFQGRHPGLLDALKLSVVRADLGDKGVFYRVQAGPLPDRSAAKSLCEQLEQRKQACLVVSP